MKKLIVHAGIAIFFTVFGYTSLIAQNIVIDLDSAIKEYSADFSKSFTIKVTSKSTDKIMVQMNSLLVPPVIYESVAPAAIKIPFTAIKGGGLSFKDKDGKTVKIAKDQKRFALSFDEKMIIINKSTTPAPGIAGSTAPATTVVKNEWQIDLDDLKAQYLIDFTKDLVVTFTAKDTKKQAVTISFKKDEKPTVLHAGVDPNKFPLSFKAEGGALVIQDASDKPYKVVQTPFTVFVGDKEVKFEKKVISAERSVAPGDEEEDNGPKVPYWSYLKGDSLKFSLAEFKLLTGTNNNCCDGCASCDDDAFVGNNRIIYDARSGLTYFLNENTTLNSNICNTKASYQSYKINHRKKIKVSAHDPLVFIVENVNPALYDLELSDSAILANAETTALLESLLLGRSEGKPGSNNTDIQGEEEAAAKQKIDEEEYLKVKTGLMLVKAEMWELLENLRKSSPYLHNCIQDKKRKALDKINGYPGTLLKSRYASYSFIQLTDIFLNQETEDSTLNHQIKALYGEFVAASWKIAYRYPQVPETDQLHFKLSITAKPNSPYPSLLKVKMKHPTQTVYIKNFFKVDVSSGLYTGFMKDQTYVLQPDTVSVRNVANSGDSVTNIKRIVDEDVIRNEIGFASFLHLYYKYSNWFNIGGAVGAGISFDKTVRPRYFLGMSLLFGTSNRVCLNGGAVWGNYQQLSNQYKMTGGQYNTLKDTESSLNYTTRFRNSWFVSVSYNLPFLTRKKSSTEASPGDND